MRDSHLDGLPWEETKTFKQVKAEKLNGKAHPSITTTSPREPFGLNDTGNAERLALRQQGRIRFCSIWNKWLIWDGKRWAIDETQEIVRLAIDTAKSIYAEAANAKDEKEARALGNHANKSLKASAIREMIKLAEAQPGIPVLPSELDTHQFLFNTQNCVIDLQDGSRLKHDPKYLITKISPASYDPHSDCPIFKKFLHRIMGESEKLERFLQRATGRALSGNVSEKILHVLHGSGDNGKSTFLEAIHATWGDDYCARTPTETLLVRHEGAIPNDVARLRGARFVYASESEEGKRLAEARIKDMTGGDTIPARFMRGEWFEFKPEFKLFLATNHKPTIRGTDKAIWNRVKLIPFIVSIPESEQDKKLAEKLRGEISGILTWAVEGCLQWQLEGLGIPEEVQAATDEYRKESDIIGAFIAECCVEKSSVKTAATMLYTSYKEWCEQNGENHMSQQAFGRRLSERGFNRERNSATGRFDWQGVGLRAG